MSQIAYPTNRIFSTPASCGEVFSICPKSYTLQTIGYASFTVFISPSPASDEVDVHYTDINFYKGLDLILDRLRSANAFVQRHQPWLLKDDRDQRDLLDAILYVPLECLRVCGLLLQPVCPTLSSRLLDRLNVDVIERSFQNCYEPMSGTPRELGADCGVLFRRLR